MTTTAKVSLAERRDAPARGRHPWVFSGAIARIDGTPEPGDVVDVHGPSGDFIGRGLFNPNSQIRVRLYRWDDGPLDEAFFAGRIREAVALRRDDLGLSDRAGACRLVFSEGDGLSGLTVDRYAGHLVVQLTSLALARRLESILDALEEAIAPESIVLRTEKGILEEEGLAATDGPLRGSAPDGPIEILEGGLRFAVDVRTGQKTGFYLDQRENRRRVARFAGGRDVADVCCYSGGFGIALAAAGARSVTAVDVSASALAMAEDNARRNEVADRFSFARTDAFSWLSREHDAGRSYGMIVLDPPRFARSKRGVPEALKAYRRLNASALACLGPGGILVTCSCSGRVAEADFAGAVGRAAADSGRTVRILERLGQAPDHPVSATCLESGYLKGFVCRVD